MHPVPSRARGGRSVDGIVRCAGPSARGGLHAAAGPRNFRHRAGRRARRSASALDRAPRRDRVRRLRDRRAGDRRGPGDNLGDGRGERAALPPETPALSDGGRQAGRSRSARSSAGSTCSIACCRRAPGAPDRPSPEPARSTCATPATPTTARPIDPLCRCPACTGFSRAYLHHLTKAREILASMLLTGA